jgi:hypothetical protein
MKFKYSYVVKQISKGGAGVQLFGRDTRLSNDQLEQMRRKINKDSENMFYVQSIGLVGRAFGASSVNSKLPAEPMFEVVS